MGFYAPDTLAHEAQRRGIAMLAPDVNASEADCTVAAAPGGASPGGAVQLGLGYVSGVRGDEVAALIAAREEGGPFRSLADLASRAGSGRPSLEKLAWAGACDALAGIDPADPKANTARRSALWQMGIAAPGEQLADGTQLALPLAVPDAPEMRRLEPWEAMIADYATTGLTLGKHPIALLRERLPAGTATCRDLESMRHHAPIRIGGLVVARQRPGTAKGIVFLLLEDEFGTINLIVPPDVYERSRLTVRTEPLILAEGRLEKLAAAGGAINVFVKRIEPLVAPGEDVAGVVELAERRAAAAAVEAPADRAAEAAVPSEVLADFRGVAPAIQNFASGRRR
jgi:error-prone DNA polymerase